MSIVETHADWRKQDNDAIAARFGFGSGHDFRDHDCSDVATWCARCERQGVELNADCPSKQKS